MKFPALSCPALFLAISLPALAAEEMRYVEGEAIVTFKPSADSRRAARKLSTHSLAFSQRFDALSSKRKRQMGLVRGENETTAELIARLQTDPDIESVEPNFLRTVTGVPNDPDFGKLWGLWNTGQFVNPTTGNPTGTSGTAGADMKFVPAMELANPSAPPVVVGVIDTGIDRHHSDLRPNLWVNAGEIPFNGIDDDGNGKIDDVHGFDFVTNTGNVTDAGVHGTHVAGTLAAAGNNSLGVIGANPRAKVMTLKVSSNGNDISSAAFVAAMDYAVDRKENGVNLVALNASFAGPNFSTAEYAGIQALDQAGIILCTGAGNNGQSNDIFPLYPGNYRLPNMIVVAASNQSDGLWTGSNHSPTKVDLAAPGANIYSSIPGAVVMSLKIGSSNYLVKAMEWAGTTEPVTGTIYDCGFGNPGEFPPGVSGNIALISRGQIVQRQKALNAMAAGAKAAIVYDNVADHFAGTLEGDGNWLPIGTITQANGNAIKALLPLTGTVTATQSAGDYISGTSMASPQVAAAVSLAAMNFPEDSTAQRIARILDNVDDKPAFTNFTITGGRLNLQRLLDSDANSLPDWWEKQFFNQYTGADPEADRDGDGQSERDEFLAATSPVDPASVLRSTSATRSVGTGHFTVEWQSVPGKSYRVAYSDSLEGGWLRDLPASLVTGAAGQTTSYTDTTAPPAGRRFYRVEVEIP